MRCPAQEGAGPFLGRTVDAEMRRAGLRGTCRTPPHPAAPGSWQSSGAGSRLLQGPPGRIWWCFSGHVFCSCSRLLFWVFFLAFTLRLPQKLAVPSTLQEPASPCPARGDAPTELALPSPGNGTHGIACTDPTDTRSSSSPKA